VKPLTTGPHVAASTSATTIRARVCRPPATSSEPATIATTATASIASQTMRAARNGNRAKSDHSGSAAAGPT
jgi:hypothetical protein